MKQRGQPSDGPTLVEPWPVGLLVAPSNQGPQPTAVP
jgi:hypothetical protein